MCYDPEFTDEEIAAMEDADCESWEAQWDAHLDEEISEIESSHPEEPPPKSPPFPTPCTGEGHTGRINGVLLTDDQRLISWSEDGTIRMWTLEGRCTRIPSEPDVAVRGVVRVNETRILFWDARNDMYFWEPSWETARRIGRQKRRIEGARIFSGKTIVLWCDDGVIYIRDATGALRGKARGHEGRVRGIEELSDGGILSWGTDGTLRTWTMNGESTGVFPGHAAAVLAATELSDGRIVSMDTRQLVIVRSEDGTVECSATFGEKNSPLDATVRATVESMQNKPNTLRNDRDRSVFEWPSRGLFRHLSARNNPLLVFGVPDEGPLDVVGDFSFRTVGGGEGKHTAESGTSHSPASCLRWRHSPGQWGTVVRHQAPQPVPKKVARQLNRRVAALSAADRKLHITIRSVWGVEVLEALNRDLLARITGIQCTSARVYYAMSGVLPELQLDILQLSFLPGTESLENLYAVQAERLVVYECPELRKIQGRNCLISEVAVLGCPLLALDSRGVYVTGPAGEANITDLEDRVPF